MLHLDTIVLETTKLDILDPNTIFDIDTHFNRVRVENNIYNAHMVQAIDQGKLLNDDCFVDRFGCTRFTEDLSTGCKAAIIIGANPTKRVALIECGDNALFEIVTHCKNGRALIYDPVNGILNFHRNDFEIDVEVDGYRFTSLDRLNYYFTDEAGLCLPDMEMEGIEYA